MERSKLQPEHLPEIIVCSEPSFDLKEMNSLGYSQSWNYIHGLEVSKNILSLTGNQTQLREGFNMDLKNLNLNHLQMT